LEPDVRNAPETEVTIRGRVRVLALVVGMGCLCASAPAAALDSPFQFEAGRWVSSKTYNENIRRHLLDPDEEKAKTNEQEKGANFVSETQVQPPSTAAPLASSPSTTAFLMPAMPGMNKGFDVQISSTEDEESKKIRLITPDMSPDGKLPDKKWKTPSAKNLLVQERESEDRENPPLNVRMTFLPPQYTPPIPSPQHESAPRKGHDKLRQMTENKKKTAPKTPEEIAAYAALDAYKKQQLDAIQSDRQTLTALQKAIHSLGLEKQLDFMTEQGSRLNTSDNQTPAPSGAPSLPDIR
jgi:hypothetical protein